ncbi:MAG: hypothetical protein AAGC77_09710, partial [Pseudomonadota bacterium]
MSESKDSYDKIVEKLKDEYFLIKQGRVWAFLGGAIAFVVAAGLISYQSGLAAVRGSAAQNATTRILGLQKTAEETVAEIGSAERSGSVILQRMNDQLNSISSIGAALDSIEKTVGGKNPWVPFSENIKDVLQGQDQFEYAISRNGGIRRLNSSEWNGGFRVTTEPYMTGDGGFRLGGSVWVWETKDRNDDRGVYHYYYYYTDVGVITEGGNGLTKADAGGEGMIYRR